MGGRARTRHLLPLLLFVLGLGLAGMATASTTDVSIKGDGICGPNDPNCKYDPPSPSIHLGDSVRWNNTDSIDHTVTSDDGSSFRAVVSKGDNFTFRFKTNGVFTYHCEYHPDMKGTITVVDQAPSVLLTAPANGATVSGQTTITGTASDPDPKDTDSVKAQVRINGGNWADASSSDGFAHWAFSFNADNFAHGSRLTIDAQAVDSYSKVSDMVTIRVVVDQNPVASFVFSPGTNITTSDVVQFNDTSTDPDTGAGAGHGPASWSWDFGDGATSAVRNATHQFLRKGTANVTLVVKDDDGGVSPPFTQQLTILNSPPRAAFNVSNDAPGLQEQVQFTDASTDIDGKVLGWAWDFGDGAKATTRNATHAYAAVGDYTVTLTAKDDDGALANVTRVLHVQNIVGKPPTANLTADRVAGRAPLTVNFTATAVDPDGSVKSATLDYGDGSTPDNVSGALLPDGFRVAHTFTEGGDFDATLRVVDNDGNVATAHRSVHADPPVNRPPSASFTVLPGATPAKNTVVRFTDTSTDPDPGDRVATWRWDFGDGTLYCCNLQVVDHVYTRTGRFAVVLTATDTRGAAGTSAPRFLDVQGQAPAVLLAAQPTTGRAPLVVNFTLAARDADGRVVRWLLDYGDGSSDNDTGAPSRTLLHAYTTPGTFGARFQAVDDDGLVGQMVIPVQVQQPLPPALVLPASAIGVAPSPDARLTYQFSAVPEVAGAARYAWSFGDGRTGSGRQVTYAYDAPGGYDVNLTVTDASGAVLATAGTRLDVVEERTGSGPRVRSEVANGVVRVSWDGDPGAAGYQVWRAAGSAPDAASFQALAVVRGDTSYSDLNVKDGASYTYRVTFFSPNGDGRFESLAELNRLTQFRLLGTTAATAFVDSDGDGVGDSQDAFPHDPTRTTGKLPGPELPLELVALGALAAWARRRQS